VIDDLKQKVLTERKRVVVNVLSRRLALTVEDWCKRYDLKTVCIHGDDAREVDDETHYAYKQRILKDVTESFVGIDVFIYTGTLTAGADIQEPFDHLIAVYMNMSTDPM
jgi:hypothetical protein